MIICNLTQLLEKPTRQRHRANTTQAYQKSHLMITQIWIGAHIKKHEEARQHRTISYFLYIKHVVQMSNLPFPHTNFVQGMKEIQPYFVS